MRLSLPCCSLSPPLQARAGLIKNFTGIDDPYEEPLSPEIAVSAFNEGAPGCCAVGASRTAVHVRRLPAREGCNPSP